jgi:small subunit ribosomal protein S13
MPRIIGVQLPDEKRLEIALTYIYGLGRAASRKILKGTGIDPNKRAKALTDQEVQVLQKKIEQYSVEGQLRKTTSENIKRLKQIGAYRGLRHKQGLPVRGQRTRTNARTKRGKRQTVGALRKEMAQKIEKAARGKGK